MLDDQMRLDKLSRSPPSQKSKIVAIRDLATSLQNSERIKFQYFAGHSAVSGSVNEDMSRKLRPVPEMRTFAE
jgi:hypothetical protein